jgi:hypothetical protein
MAVFYADGALTRSTLRWRNSAEITAAGVAADFHSVHVAPEIGARLVELVTAHIADLDAIRIQLLSRALPGPLTTGHLSVSGTRLQTQKRQ